MFHFIKKCTFIFTLMIILFNQAAATTFYVNSGTGNDNYSGLSSTYTGGITGPVKTIQKAINISVANDKIVIAPGIYRENVVIRHQLDLSGAGSGSDSTLNTILQSSINGSGIGIDIAMGSSPSAPANLKNMRITGYNIGVVMSRSVLYSDLSCTGNNYGFHNNTNDYLRDAGILSCEISNSNIAGIYISHTCNIIAFTIDSCIFKDNFGGIYAYCDNPSTSNIIDFMLKNSVFYRQKQKGIYVEKLDNSIFENLIFDSCGIDTNYSWNAGIDVNLKYANYSNLLFSNCEFRYCGIGGAPNSGCGMTIKARDDGSVYGANPATLKQVKIIGLLFQYCQNGLMFGEPGKNNAGPEEITIQESRSVFNSSKNITSNIKADMKAHNCSWLSTDGPSPYDTAKNSTGHILVYTWIKDVSDKKTAVGFQSDSIVWFGNTDTSLQRAIDVIPYNWSLFLPSKQYNGSYFISSRLNLLPDKTVYLSALSVRSFAEVLLNNNDLYITDSLILKEGAYFSTGEFQAELSDSCLIREFPGNPVLGTIRTFRNLNGNPAVENFGGLGISINSTVTSTFPYNNIVVIRTTGKASMYSKKQVLRTYKVLTHSLCGWDATLDFAYDDSELENLFNDHHLQLMRSYDNGIKWILSGGTTDTITNQISLMHADVLQGLWTMIDSSGAASPPNIYISSKVNHITCHGAQNGKIETEVSGGFPPYAYLWSIGDTLCTIDSLSAGIYILQVQDTGNCSITDTFIIKEPAPIDVSFNTKAIKCFGDSTGEAEVIINGGTSPYSILWKDGEKNTLIKNRTSGYYNLHVTDSNACFKTDSVFIPQSDPIDLGLMVNPIRCNGYTDGIASVQITGGKEPYLTFWSTGESGNSISKLQKGSYFVVVYDSHMCLRSDTFEISEPLEITLTLSGNNLTCFHDGSGKIHTSVSGGRSPYKFLWSNKDTTATIEQLAAGSYSVIVSDSSNCQQKDSIELTEPSAISFQFTLKNDTNNKCIGSITALISGGQPPYDYLWDDPASQQTPVANGLCAGLYTLQITDSALCIADSIVELFNIINDYIINDNSLAFTVFPNPFHDQICIKSPVFPVNYFMWDAYGRITRTGNLQNKKSAISTAGFPEGIYFLQLIEGENIFVFKLIKN